MQNDFFTNARIFGSRQLQERQMYTNQICKKCLVKHFSENFVFVFEY